MKDTFKSVIEALIANITNLNSKRLAVCIIFLILSYRILMFSVPANFKPLVDPSLVYGAMAGVVAYWMKKDSDRETDLAIGEKKNGHSKEDKDGKV